jgi:2-oxo-4-hydroxy-4-carboxy-5-ureidoimidazoline decarboxylase
MVHSLEACNALSGADFVRVFSGIAENSPWVAELAAVSRPFVSRDEMVLAFQSAVIEADEPAQMALLRDHPSLAGRAAIAGGIGDFSRAEQAGAGLDALTPEEFSAFTAINTSYEHRFGFPFIFAVRGADKAKIFESYRWRAMGSPIEERLTALAQVCRIMRFRIEDAVQE